MAYHGVCNKSNIMDVTSGAGIAYPFGASEFIAGFGEIHVARYTAFCVVVYHCFVHRLPIVLSIDLCSQITPLVSSNFS